MRGATAISAADLERLRAAIAARLGLAVSEERTGSLVDLLERRSRANGLSAAAYLASLEQGVADDEVHALAQALTIPETYFFRDADQFRALSEVALPQRVRVRQRERHLRLLSLGCASGEEAYSLAIAARTIVPDAAWHVSVTGIDVNGAALEKARAARYSTWSLRATPPRDVTRWFRPAGAAFVLDEAFRSAVRFEQANLAAERASWAVPGSCDVVFLRNVIMYFTPAQARALVERVADALAPGGYLFLGHAETLRGVSQAFELKHSHSTFYYRRVQRHVAEGRTTMSDLWPGGAADAGRDGSSDWTDVIRHASQRVAALAPRHDDDHFTAEGSVTDREGILRRALDLMAREEFGAVAASLASLPRTVAEDPELRLVRGVSLVQQGHIGMAADLARALLAGPHGHTAAAHHLLALCLEAAGDADAAARHWQVCVHLEPAAGLAHLHLGRLARRAGDAETARKALSAALVLLPGERPVRLLLFGGGFSRSALLDLCRAELARCGAPRE